MRTKTTESFAVNRVVVHVNWEQLRNCQFQQLLPLVQEFWMKPRWLTAISCTSACSLMTKLPIRLLLFALETQAQHKRRILRRHWPDVNLSKQCNGGRNCCPCKLHALSVESSYIFIYSSPNNTYVIIHLLDACTQPFSVLCVIYQLQSSRNLCQLLLSP